MPQNRQLADQALDSAEVAWVVGKRAAAVRAEDAEYLASRYAPGAVSFGFAPPLSPHADESHRVEWLREWFDRYDGRIDYRVEELTVSVAGDVAFCHGRERFSAPYTVFGPKRAVIYAGEIYLVFTATELIREFTSHFDNLIRNAKVQPNECAGFVRALISEVA